MLGLHLEKWLSMSATAHNCWHDELLLYNSLLNHENKNNLFFFSSSLFAWMAMMWTMRILFYARDKKKSKINIDLACEINTQCRQTSANYLSSGFCRLCDSWFLVFCFSFRLKFISILRHFSNFKAKVFQLFGIDSLNWE